MHPLRKELVDVPIARPARDYGMLLLAVGALFLAGGAYGGVTMLKAAAPALMGGGSVTVGAVTPVQSAVADAPPARLNLPFSSPAPQLEQQPVKGGFDAQDKAVIGAVMSAGGIKIPAPGDHAGAAQSARDACAKSMGQFNLINNLGLIPAGGATPEARKRNEEALKKLSPDRMNALCDNMQKGMLATQPVNAIQKERRRPDPR